MRIAIPNVMIPNRHKAACDVQDELQFHIEMLERKYTQSGMSTAQAKAAAVKRFGNLEKVKRQCVDISRRNSFVRRMLKTFTIVLALTGLSIIILASDYKVTRIGTMLLMIAIFSRLLLYARGFVTSTFPPRPNERALSVFRKDT